jgi:hypothetical protein
MIQMKQGLTRASSRCDQLNLARPHMARIPMGTSASMRPRLVNQNSRRLAKAVELRFEIKTMTSLK